MTGLRRERSRAYLGRSVGMSYTIMREALQFMDLGNLPVPLRMRTAIKCCQSPYS